MKRILCALAVLLGIAFPMAAQATLTIAPSTWNVIGLDSNVPTAGPKYFPVGAKVCSDVAVTNVPVDFSWDSANAYINTRTGSNTSITIPSIAAGACADAFFEVEVTQTALAYNTARRYHISSGAVSTPVPRELYVDRLISQGRNGVTDIKLNGVSVAAGGSMSLVVGNTYTIELDAFTATQGYSELESFINFSNAIFQLLDVTTTYSVVSSPNSGGVTTPNKYLYADSCLWDNDPNSPTYRSCLGSGNAGGTIKTIYTVKILSSAYNGTTQTLSTLAHDSSGGSFHYNGDYSTSARYANIVDPTSLTIAKSFFPNPAPVGGVSTLTFTITNPNTGPVSGLGFSDTLPSVLLGAPGNMMVDTTPNAYSSCGGTVTAVTGSGSISLSGGTAPASGSCTVQVNVTAPATGAYNNTSGNLFVGSTDTGHSASASLTVNNTPALPAPPATCTTQSVLAQWVGMGATAPPTYTAKASDVSALTTTTSYVTVSGANSMATIGGHTNAWGGTAPTGAGPGGWAETATSMANYFQFQVDSSNYGGVTITYDAGFYANADWASPNSNIYVNTSANGGAYTAITPVQTGTKGSWTLGLSSAAATTGTGTTTFRIGTTGAGANKPAAAFYLDNIYIKGCARPVPPTITKAFSSSTAGVGGTATLTFTVTNPNANTLPGISFTDTLPMVDLQGTVAVNNGSPAVTGTGTAFKTQLVAGSIVSINGVTYTVSAIASNTSLTLTANYAGATAGNLAMKAGLTVATGSMATCGGTLTTTAPSTISFTGGSIAASSSCTTTAITVTAGSAGQHNNVSDAVTSTGSGANNTANGIAKASITAILPPSISKLFSPNQILAGGVSTLTFNVTNPNTNNALSGIAFNDTFPIAPAQMRVASTSASGGTIAVTNSSPAVVGTGTSFLNTYAVGESILVAGVYYTIATITDNTHLTLAVSYAGATASGLSIIASYSGCGTPAFTPVATSTSVAFSAGSIAAGGTCIVKVAVTAPNVGAYANTSGTVSAATAGNGNTAADTLNVVAAHPQVSLLKQVSNNPAGPWSTYQPVTTGANVYYKFTVENPGDVDLSSVTVSDPALGGTIAGCTTATLAKYNTVTCTAGPVTSVAGVHINTATASGSYAGGTCPDGNPSPCTSTSSAYYVTTGLTLIKSATQSSFTGAGNVLNYSFVVQNTGSATMQGPVTVSDSITSVTPNVPVTVTCPAASTAILTASLPAVVPGDGDNWLDPGEQITCTASYTVLAADVAARLVTNAATASISTITSPATSLTIPIASPSLTLLKTVAVISDPVNGTSNPKFIPGAVAEYTIIASNSGGPVDDNSTVIADPVPANTALYVNNIAGCANSGPVCFAQSATSSTLNYTFTALNNTADDIDFSSDGGATWTAVPAPGANGCDSTINRIRVNPKGTFAGGAPNPGFQLQFRVCVQ